MIGSLPCQKSYNQLILYRYLFFACSCKMKCRLKIACPQARLSRPEGGDDKQDPKGKESANDGEGIVVHQPFYPKEGTVKKPLVVLFGILALILPLMFFGCSGDGGSTGAPGAQGPTGDN